MSEGSDSQGTVSRSGVGLLSDVLMAFLARRQASEVSEVPLSCIYWEHTRRPQLCRPLEALSPACVHESVRAAQSC